MQYWGPAGVTPEDKDLVALGTIEGGVSLAELAKTPPLKTSEALGERTLDRLAVVYGERPFSEIEPLEPDLVGELFVLEHLRPRSTLDDRIQRVLEHAWMSAPSATRDFLERCSADFADHDMIEPLLLAEGTHRQVFERQATLVAIASRLEKSDRVAAATRLLLSALDASPKPPFPEQVLRGLPEGWLDDPESIEGKIIRFEPVPGGINWEAVYYHCLYMFDTRTSAARLAMRLAEQLVSLGEKGQALRLAEACRTFAQRHAKEIGVAEAAAWTTFEGIGPAAERGRDEAFACLQDLISFGEQWPDTPAVVDPVAKACVNVVSLVEDLTDDQRTKIWDYLWRLRERPGLSDYPSHHRIAEAASALIRTSRSSGPFEPAELMAAVDALPHADPLFVVLRARNRLSTALLHIANRNFGALDAVIVDVSDVLQDGPVEAQFMLAESIAGISADLAAAGSLRMARAYAARLDSLEPESYRWVAARNLVVAAAIDANLPEALIDCERFGRSVGDATEESETLIFMYPDAVWHLCNLGLAVREEAGVSAAIREAFALLARLGLSRVHRELCLRMLSAVGSSAGGITSETPVGRATLDGIASLPGESVALDVSGYDEPRYVNASRGLELLGLPLLPGRDPAV